MARPADEPALRYVGYSGVGTPVCLTGEVPRLEEGAKVLLAELKPRATLRGVMPQTQPPRILTHTNYT